MTRIRTFQLMVLISTVSFVVWFVLAYVPIHYPADIQNLLDYDGYDSVPWLKQPLIYISFALLKLAAALGMFFLLSWGRWLFVGTILIAFAFVPFSGIGISPPLETFLGGVLWLTDGGILALAFASPIAECWRKDV